MALCNYLDYKTIKGIKLYMSDITLDTIYALSSASGRAGVSVIRVSGARAQESLSVLTGGMAVKSRKATLCKLINPMNSEVIDHALVLSFNAPFSFTGENCVEYQCHGSPAVIKELLSCLGDQEGHRMAEPGEFTRRAFENGKMDLTEAEAVADLIHAETALQKQQALVQLEGGLSSIYREWSERLKKSLAYLEASIDFADEELPEGFLTPILVDLSDLNRDIVAHLNDNRRGERLRDGFSVVVIGVPNSGKSSLINCLAQREVAIVSDVSGTTRDVIEAHLDIGGYPVIVSDTAGLRPKALNEEGHDKIESEGIRRALERAKTADLKILMFDGSQSLDAQRETFDLLDEQSLVVINKSDLEKNIDLDGIEISAQGGKNISVLLDAIKERLDGIMGGMGEGVSLTRERHRHNLSDVLESLARALSNEQIDLMAEDIRLAMRFLGKITGRVDVEDLLDVIFSDFCIGK